MFNLRAGALRFGACFRGSIIHFICSLCYFLLYRGLLSGLLQQHVPHHTASIFAIL